MASRIAINSLRATARPRVMASMTSGLQARSMASSSNPPPQEKAAEIVNSLPSKSGLISKTGTALLGTGIAAAAISQELYVVNEESIVLLASIIVFTYIGKVIREPYSQWAEGHINRIKGILNSARSEHTDAVKERISSVSQMKDVSSITEGLFALSKETAKLESETFVQQQKVAVASEIKSVLDSWVRYEQQVKESEQAELTKAVIDKVLANLKDQATQKELLTSAVTEIEQLVKAKAI
ncbi:hypothetical protein EST38_g13549 [Candolleomyces aberdarensis]|uniref:ATP synthase subunit 4 n=1 Tax=Candolleomyces aberdarensis TaxID=2316362 RepID=A0A4Q2D2D3_9AGAR|nr:hypothetical protein EST38_g13549 [Candolleomyces aberdarensis]